MMIKQILLEFDASTNQPIPRMPLNQYPMGAVPDIKDQIDDHVKRNWLKYLMAAGMLGRSAHNKYGNFNANAAKLQQMQNNHAQLSTALKNGQHDDVIKALQPQMFLNQHQLLHHNSSSSKTAGVNGCLVVSFFCIV